jgi:hypothetical protein
MKQHPRDLTTARIGFIAALGVALCGASCSSGEEATTPGTGGAGATAGAGATGGAGGTAGTGGSAGAAGSAGGSGGATGGTAGASGGSAGAVTGGSGGTAGTGGGGSGVGGSAGKNGDAGSGGAGGAGAGGSAGTAGGGAGGGAAGSAGCLTFGEPMEVGTIASTELPGPSGIAASRTHAGVIYGHADAGGMPRFFAFDKTGKALGEYRLTGGMLTDWEDIAVGPGPDNQSYVFIGDFGDNSVNRTEVQVIKVPEPNVSVSQAAVTEDIATFEVLRFTYPGGARDTETLMIDPVTKDILIVTKTAGMAQVYRAPGNTPANMPRALELLTTVMLTGSGQAAQVSAGDISPTGDRIMLRTYTRILVWPRIAGPTIGPSLDAMPTDNPQPDEPQGEGLTFSSDGSSWIAAGEQEKTIYEGTADCP